MRVAPEQGRQIAQQLRTAAHTVAELHPGVLATEAGYGRDCGGEELSTWERLGKGLAAVGGWVSGRLRRALQTVARQGARLVQAGAQVVVMGFARARRVATRAFTHSSSVIPPRLGKPYSLCVHTTGVHPLTTREIESSKIARASYLLEVIIVSLILILA